MSTKYQVGDKVWVEVAVEKVDTADENRPIRIDWSEWPLISKIKNHIPKPREFKPGDIVTWGTGAISLEFLAARNGRAIMWNNEEGCVENEPLSDIRHADDVTPNVKRRWFKLGGKVRSGLDKADYELVATRGQVAFLWCQEQLYGRTAPLDTIRHVDEAAP